MGASQSSKSNNEEFNALNSATFKTNTNYDIRLLHNQNFPLVENSPSVEIQDLRGSGTILDASLPLTTRPQARTLFIFGRVDVSSLRFLFYSQSTASASTPLLSNVAARESLSENVSKENIDCDERLFTI